MGVDGMSQKHTAALIAVLLHIQGERAPVTTKQVCSVLGSTGRYGLRILRALEGVGAVVHGRQGRDCVWSAQDIDVACARSTALAKKQTNPPALARRPALNGAPTP